LTEQARAAGLPADTAVLERAAPLVQQRIQTLRQGAEMLRFLLVRDDEFGVDEAAAGKHLGDTGRPVLEAAITALEPLREWRAEAIEDALKTSLLDGLGLKPRNAFAPIRVAVSGSAVSPPLFESLEILGRERSLQRMRAALA
jgi:glutamyl-tRNA synthetase